MARCLVAEVDGVGEVLSQVGAVVQAEAGPGARARAVGEVKGVREVVSQVPENISHLDFGVLTDARAGVSQVDLEALRLSMARQPKVPFPTVNDIEAMSSQESAERFQWFFSVFLCIFLVVLLVGTAIMQLVPLASSALLT